MITSDGCEARADHQTARETLISGRVMVHLVPWEHRMQRKILIMGLPGARGLSFGFNTGALIELAHADRDLTPCGVS